MHEFVLLKILTIGLGLALVFGLVATRLRLSPIVGYLLAGFLIGPHSPGFVADMGLAYELSEVGVILLMFAVGMHFDLKDLLAVKGVAVPGALVQTSAATVCGLFVGLFFGLSVPSGLILGLCLAVASTVVLMRMLEETGAMSTIHGHVAVGWLVVEDIITVFLLVLLPTLAGIFGSVEAPSPAVVQAVVEGGAQTAAHGAEAVGIVVQEYGSYMEQALDVGAALGMAILRLAALWILILPVGGRIVPWIMAQVAKTRSNELFTLTILALAFVVAVGAAVFFDTSVALGAFLAGMVVGKTKGSHRAAADLLPLRDTFAVLFFLSVGMLFNPMFVVENPGLILACTMIVLVVKPVTALFTVAALGYSARTAMTVAAGLSQVGEFSFILATQAQHYNLISSKVYNVLVVCALISITVNPWLFTLVPKVEAWLRRHEGLWRLMNRKAYAAAMAAKEECHTFVEEKKGHAIVVGYGPTGRSVVAALHNQGVETVVVDLNMDTVNAIAKEGGHAVFGDSGHRSILEAAGVEDAMYLLLTTPDISAARSTAIMALGMNSRLTIIARARFIQDVDYLLQTGVTEVAVEENEVALAMVHMVEKAMKAEEQATPDLIMDNKHVGAV